MPIDLGFYKFENHGGGLNDWHYASVAIFRSFILFRAPHLKAGEAEATCCALWGGGHRPRTCLRVEGAFNRARAALKNVSVDHGGFYVFVAQ